MALTPEQFNKLATKEDLKNFATKDELTSAKNDILTAVDHIAKKFDDHKTEHIANQAAHDRFQEEIDGIKKHVGINPSLAHIHQ